VVVDEFWGTLLNEDGTVAHERVMCSVANEKYLIRPVEKFPFWHGESPFVKIPFIRKPFSVWHKALYDDVVGLNLAINELFNLMLDGGIASVWGIKQLRMDYLEDPRQVSGGIPQGKTLAIREDAPDGAKVLEQVTEGNVPTDALAMFNLLDREHNAAAKTNDIKLGNLPSRQVKATEVLESSQASDAVLDSITGDVEVGISKVLRKAFLTIMQNADDLLVDSNKLAQTLCQFISRHGPTFLAAEGALGASARGRCGDDPLDRAFHRFGERHNHTASKQPTQCSHPHVDAHAAAGLWHTLPGPRAVPPAAAGLLVPATILFSSRRPL